MRSLSHAGRSLRDLDLVDGQTVELVRKLVDLPIRRRDLPLKRDLGADLRSPLQRIASPDQIAPALTETVAIS